MPPEIACGGDPRRRTPDSFEALSVFAYIETQFQDYPVAAELYRRALAVQDSAALRSALSNLPGQQQ